MTSLIDRWIVRWVLATMAMAAMISISTAIFVIVVLGYPANVIFLYPERAAQIIGLAVFISVVLGTWTTVKLGGART